MSNWRTPLAVLLALFFLLPIANALFLVGEAAVGGEMSILCESQERVFVSAPDGTTRQIDLDTSFQAEFAPAQPGPHTVQCGKETATVQVAALGAAGAERASERQDSVAVLAALAIFLAILAAAAVLAARMLFSATVFSKSVEGKRCRLHLRAGKRLGKIEIEDPVSFSHNGKPLRFSIPSLSAGREWGWEYDIELPEKALPASLEAEQNGKKIAMLSKLIIEGKETAHSGAGTSAPQKIKKVLPKAR